MKKLRCALALLLCILLTVFCAAGVSADEVSYRIKELNMSIKIPDTMTVRTRDNTEDMADTLYLEATNSDSTLTLTISMIQNDKTKEIYSFEELSSSALQEYKDQMLQIDGYLSCNTSTYGSVKFLDFDQKFSTENGGVIYGKQSVTLVNGMNISISSQSTGDSFTSDELGLIKGCLESIKFTSLKTGTSENVSFWTVLLWIFIILLILGVAFLALSFYMGRRSTRKKQEARREKRKKADYDVLKQADENRRRKAQGTLGGYKTSSDYFDSDFESQSTTATATTDTPATGTADSKAAAVAEKALGNTSKAFTHMGYFFKNLRREMALSKKNKKPSKKSKKAQSRRRQSRDYDVFSDR